MAKYLIIFVVMNLILLKPLQAQEQPTLVKRSVATVLFASIGGAVLGLSTLSFYGDPAEHTENIGYGALLGFVGGMTYLSLKGYQSVHHQPPTYSDFEIRQNKMKIAGTRQNVPALLTFRFEY